MEGKWKEKGTDRMILKDIWLDVKAVQERDPAAEERLRGASSLSGQFTR